MSANKPDPDDYDEKLAAMTSSEALELGLKEVHEVACAFYIRHKYNQSVVEAFMGDEYFGANRSVVLRERTGRTVKTMQKVFAGAKAAVGITDGLFSEKAPRKAEEAKDLVPRSRQNKEAVFLRGSVGPRSRRYLPEGSWAAANRSASIVRSLATM